MIVMTYEFTKKVWELTRRIPKGRVSTYSEVAKAMKTRAYRAVGNALNRNPHIGIVPCHRVVAKNGGIGGFSRGIPEKIRMLNKEGIAVKNHRIVDFEKKLFRFKHL